MVHACVLGVSCIGSGGRLEASYSQPCILQLLSCCWCSSIVYAFPTGCNINLPVAREDEIHGEYITDGWIISFRTILKDGTIRAATTFKNITTSEEGEEEHYEFFA